MCAVDRYYVRTWSYYVLMWRYYVRTKSYPVHKWRYYIHTWSYVRTWNILSAHVKLLYMHVKLLCAHVKLLHSHVKLYVRTWKVLLAYVMLTRGHVNSFQNFTFLHVPFGAPCWRIYSCVVQSYTDWYSCAYGCRCVAVESSGCGTARVVQSFSV